MSQQKVADDVLREAVAAYQEHGGVKAYAARSLGLHPRTFGDRLKMAEERFAMVLGEVAGGSIQATVELTLPSPSRFCRSALSWNT